MYIQTRCWITHTSHTPGTGRRMRSRLFSRQAAATIATATLCCVVPLSRGFVQHPHPVARTGRRAVAGGRGMNMMVKIEDVLKSPKWPEEPFYRPGDFSRQDESSDTAFYDSPRLVTHIDDAAINALTTYYATVLPSNCEILDICSSWISHYPPGIKFKRAVGMGMNKFELSKNKQLDDFVVKDLNVDPAFPFPDASFDVVTCVVSVDYLIKPLDVFKEIGRVLRPGGMCIMSFSNRCFPTKAIQLWLETGNEGHAFLIGSYFHYGSPDFEPPVAKDISPNPGRSDPMFIVQASKKKA